jgi:hypothetical protein
MEADGVARGRRQQALSDICENNDAIALDDFLKKTEYTPLDLQGADAWVLDEILERDAHRVLRRLITHYGIGGDMLGGAQQKFLRHAIANGLVEMLEVLTFEGGLDCSHIQTGVTRLMRAVAARGDLATIECMTAHGYLHPSQYGHVFAAMHKAAARVGHVHVVKWLDTRFPRPRYPRRNPRDE